MNKKAAKNIPHRSFIYCILPNVSTNRLLKMSGEMNDSS